MRRFGFGLLILSALAFNASATPFLGSGWNFSVLGATTVTNSGATTLNANLGVSPGTAVTGSGSITFSGAPPNNRIVSQSEAAAGQIAATNAVNQINTLGAGTTVGSALIGLDGLTLSDTGGTNTVYTVAASPFTLTAGGVLTLNFNGHSNENIIFLTPSSTLIADTGSSVRVINANSTDNVFWEVGSSATLNAGVSFVGNIIASASVSMLDSAKIGCGSVVAQTGQVSMLTNTISDTCSYAPITGTVTPTLGSGTPVIVPIPPSGITEAVPEGGSTFLYLGFLLVPIGAMRAFRRRSV